MRQAYDRRVTGVRVDQVPIAKTRVLRQSILRSHETIEQLAAQEPADAFAAGGFDGERLIAVGIVAPSGEPGRWRVRGMATAADERGRGAGRGVLDALVEHARANGGTSVWCNARVPARSFYERAGFRVCSDVFDVPPIGPHLVMERELS
jgi:ribosomal protein S18 acetylase RimI-like enzyme